MKFKTRLRVTFITIIFLPLLLTTLAFCVIGVYLMNAQPGVSIQNLDFAMISESVGNFTGHADNVYHQLTEQEITSLNRMLFNLQMGMRQTLMKAEEGHWEGDPAVLEAERKR